MFPKERDPNKAMLAKVIPTPNNGFAELVALQRDQVDLLCTLFKTWSTCKFNLKPFLKKNMYESQFQFRKPNHNIFHVRRMKTEREFFLLSFKRSATFLSTERRSVSSP